MRDSTLALQSSFENCAAHLANLDEMKRLVEQLLSLHYSYEETISFLEEKMQEAETTLKTDIRILINELRHRVSAGKSSA